MADDDEKSPLLENVSGPALEIPEPRRRIRNLFESDQVLGRHGNCLSQGVGAINISDVSPELLAAETDHIVAIFVVAFDTKAGNVIEWCMPEDADLEGVEFKAMVSGSHRLDKDFVYFRKDALFGLACFENMPVESAIERGARMKSVGILATSYTLLYRHMQFLETQVRFLLTYPEDMTTPHWPGDDRHMLNTPGKYGRLKAFYEDKKGVLVNSGSSHSLAGSSTPLSTPGSEILPALKITHPAGCFTQFIQFFGDQIFVLWKYALLGKRILFFSPPPIGVVCYRVYCACCLANHHIGSSLTNRELTPHFYVNVADIESLETELSYIACTTEKIFEMKSNLYDVYVDNQNVTTHSEVLKDLLKISDADRDKFNKLNTQRSAHQFSREELGEDTLDDEDVFTSFFTEQNNHLFQTLLDVSMSQDRTLTADHMRSMGLDPVGDRSFLMELVETYGVDVILMVDNPCCPR